MLSYITSQDAGRGYLTLAKGDKVALLVNNLGASTGMELSVATRKAILTLEGPAYGVSVERVFVGPFMTALDMVGLSVSVLKLSGDGGEPPRRAVHRARVAGRRRRRPQPHRRQADAALRRRRRLGRRRPAARGRRAARRDAERRRREAIKAAANALIAKGAAHRVGRDRGGWRLRHDLADGGTALLADVGAYPLSHPASTALALACSLGKSMGGSSGALYSIFLNAVAVHLGAANVNTPAAMAAAFSAGCAAMSEYGGASKGHRTMLDALLPAAEAMEAAAALPPCCRRRRRRRRRGRRRRRAWLRARGAPRMCRTRR